MVGLSEIKTDIEVILLLPVWFLEVGHDFASCAFYLCAGSDDCDFFVLLLDVVEGMIDFLEGRLSADSELRDPWLAFERWHVVDHSLDLVWIEVQSFYLEGGEALLDFVIGLEYAFLAALDEHLAADFKRIALLVQKQSMVVDGHLR